MPPALRGLAATAVASANNVQTPTNLVPTLPAHQIEDLLLCYTVCRATAPTVATPSEWTQLVNVAGTVCRLALFGKIAVSASETNPTITWSGLSTGTGGTPVQAQCAVFSGMQNVITGITDLLGTIQNAAGSTTIAASGLDITTLAASDLVVSLSVRPDDVGTWAAPSGFTMIGSALTTSGADNAFAWSYQVKTAAGLVAPADYALTGGPISQASAGIMIALKQKVAQTHFGVISRPFTFQSFVDGDVVIPAVTHYGSFEMPVGFESNISGSRKTFGQLDLPVTFSKDIQGQRKTFGQLSSPLIFGKTISGRKTTFGQVEFPINVGITTAGIRVGLTQYGVIALPVTFGKDIRGQRKTFGQVALPVTFSKDVKAVRKTFGKFDLPIIFTKEAVGRKNVFGQLSMQTLFGKEIAGSRKTFGQVSLPVIFSKEISGRKKTFGQVFLPINASIVVAGFVSGRKHLGAISLPITFGKEVIAQRKTFGQITAPFIFGSSSQGTRRTLGKIDFPIGFIVNVKSGPVGIHGKISFPIIVGITTAGKVIPVGIILNSADNVYLGAIPVLAVYVEDKKVWSV